MIDPERKSATAARNLPAWPWLVAIAIAAGVAAARAVWGSGADRGAVDTALVSVVVLGAALGPLLLLSPGAPSAVKLLWLGAALSPALVAALHIGVRAALGGGRQEFESALALGAAGALALLGLRRRIVITRLGLGLAAAIVVTALASTGAALVWSGAGPNFAGLGFEHWGAPRFALVAAAERDLAPLSPWQAGAALDRPFVLPQVRAALGSLLGLGPLALAAAEVAWAIAVQGFAAAFLAAAVFRRGGAVLAAVLAALFAPAGVSNWFAPATEPLGTALARVDGLTVLAFVAAGWVSQIHGDPRRAGTQSWRVVGAALLCCAFLADPWLGGAALVASLLAALLSRSPIERALPLLVAALPGAAFMALGWPQSRGEESGFAPLSLWLVGALFVSVLVLVAQRRAATNMDRARSFDLVRTVAAALIVAALAAIFVGGSASHDVFAQFAWLGAAVSFAAASLLIDRDRVGSIVALVFAAVVVVVGLGTQPTLELGARLAAGRAPVVDDGPARLVPQRDDPKRVAAAWAAEPPADLYDPTWREPIDVEGPAADDLAALWHFLATDPVVRAANPVLVVDLTQPGTRYAGGVRLSRSGGPHEASFLARLDLFVDRPHAAWRGANDEHASRLRAATAFFERDGPGLATRAHLHSLRRPYVVAIGRDQRRAVQRSARVDLARRLFEFGIVECWSRGEAALFAWPPDFAARVRGE